MSIFKTANLGARRSDGKPEVSWNGTGKHPILNMTKEEIVAMNEAVTDKHEGTRVDTDEKKAQPSHQEEVVMMAQQAADKQTIFIDNLATGLTSGKP